MDSIIIINNNNNNNNILVEEQFCFRTDSSTITVTFNLMNEIINVFN